MRLSISCKCTADKFVWSTVLTLVGIILCCAVDAQENESPMVDTFGSSGSGSYQSIGPGQFSPGLIFPNPASTVGLVQPDSNILWERITAEVEAFKATLPKDTASHFTILKGLIKQRLDNWDTKPTWWDMEAWEEKCGLVLEKLPKDYPEFHCYLRWCEVFNLADCDYCSGDSEQKRLILEKWAEAEKICSEVRYARQLAQEHGQKSNLQPMPPLAPPLASSRSKQSVMVPLMTENASTQPVPDIAPQRKPLSDKFGGQAKSQQTSQLTGQQAGQQSTSRNDMENNLPTKPLTGLANKLGEGQFDGQPSNATTPLLLPIAPDSDYDVFNRIPEDVNPEFRDKVKRAWEELPKADRDVMKLHGIKINIVKDLQNESGSDGLYNPAQKAIFIGQFGNGSSALINWVMENIDPRGTLQHEAGHALYDFMNFKDAESFQALYKVSALKISSDEFGDLGHFVGPTGPSETFAELYAALRGRNTQRTLSLKSAFPELYTLMQKNFSRSD